MTTMLKCDRLIEAAKARFYHQGVVRTTLADIAQQAQVPLVQVQETTCAMGKEMIY